MLIRNGLKQWKEELHWRKKQKLQCDAKCTDMNSNSNSMEEHGSTNDSIDDSEPEIKRRRQTITPEHDSTDDMPMKFNHIRNSLRKVRPEFYETVDKLLSCYHLSQQQAESAVIED